MLINHLHFCCCCCWWHILFDLHFCFFSCESSSKMGISLSELSDDESSDDSRRDIGEERVVDEEITIDELNEDSLLLFALFFSFSRVNCFRSLMSSTLSKLYISVCIVRLLLLYASRLFYFKKFNLNLLNKIFFISHLKLTYPYFIWVFVLRFETVILWIASL